MEEANDSIAKGIIVETLHPKMVIMLGSQLMTTILSKVVAYTPLEEEYEHKEKYICVRVNDMKFPTIEDFTDDSSPSDEDIDKMEGVFADRFLELITKDQGKLLDIEYLIGDLVT